MLTIQLTRAISSETAIAALVIAVSFLINALTRLLVLCVLAVCAARTALQDVAGGQPDAAAIRAHRLAVLQAILVVLKPRDGPGGGSAAKRNKPTVARPTSASPPSGGPDEGVERCRTLESVATVHAKATGAAVA